MKERKQPRRQHFSKSLGGRGIYIPSLGGDFDDSIREGKSPDPHLNENRRTFLKVGGFFLAVILGGSFGKTVFDLQNQKSEIVFGREEVNGDDWPYPPLGLPTIPDPAKKNLIYKLIQNVEEIRAKAPSDELCIFGPCPESFTEQKVLEILERYTSDLYPNGSPFLHSGESMSIWIDIPKLFQIDPRIILAIFIKESSAGVAPGWIGHKPDGTTTRNIGNIRCYVQDTSRCFKGFMNYESWAAAIMDLCILLCLYAAGEVASDGRELVTIEQIIPVYAPASDNNDPDGYIATVKQLVNEWS